MDFTLTVTVLWYVFSIAHCRAHETWLNLYHVTAAAAAPQLGHSVECKVRRFKYTFLKLVSGFDILNFQNKCEILLIFIVETTEAKSLNC